MCYFLYERNSRSGVSWAPPVLCYKEWVEHKAIIFVFIFFMFISFLLYCAGKRKEMNQRKENRRLSKETVKCFIKDFAVTSYGQNLLKTQLFLVKVPSGLRPSSLLKEQAYLQYHNEVVKPFCTFRHSSTAKEGNPLRLTK